MSFSPKPGAGKKFGAANRTERPSMHPATCSKCRTACEVPFKPNGKKPIFCSNCFHKELNAAPRSNAAPQYDRSSKFEKPAYQSTPRMGSEEVAKLLKSLDGKMDQILDALSDLSNEA